MIDIEQKYLDMVLQLIEQFVPQCEVWAYGSRVNGTSHRSSDLDLVIRNPADLEKSLPAINDLKIATGESNIPLIIDILDWARTPEHFRREILNSPYQIIAGRVEK